MKITTDNKTAFYASCSFNEMLGYDSIAEAENSDVLILGRHSPVYKKAFGLTFEVYPETVIVSDAAYDSADPNTRKCFDEHALKNCDGITVRMN